MYERVDWYDDPLLYDIVFDAETTREADFLEAALRRHGRRGGRTVLEPACGSGRLVAELASRGHRVTGFDRSESMLDFARRRLRARGLRARLVQGRLERFALGRRYDLAHCLVSTFQYLPDERSALAHLRCVARSLAPGGIYVLGLHLADYSSRSRLRERWTARRGDVEVVCNIQSWPPDRRRRTERMRSRLTVRRRGEERRFETEWTFRTYGPRQLRALLREVAELRHVATHDFGCDIEREIPFDGGRLDNVLILQKEPAG